MNQNNKFIGYLQHGTKTAAVPHRQQQSPRRPGAPHGSDSTTIAGLAELGLQGRVEWHHQPEHVRRSSEPASSAITSAWTATPPTRATSRSPPTRSSAAAGTGSCGVAATSTRAPSATSRTTFLGGSHNFKFGGEYLDENRRDAVEPVLRRQRDPFRERRPQQRAAVGEPLPRSVRLQQQRRIQLERAGVHERSFVTDTWTDQAPHDEHRRAIRPLPRVPARADSWQLAGSSPRRRSFSRGAPKIIAFNHIVPRLGASVRS